MNHKHLSLWSSLALLFFTACGKEERQSAVATGSQSPIPVLVQGSQAMPNPPVKTTIKELTNSALIEAFKRASINTLPVFLKIADVQFEVVNSVDATRVIKGTVKIEFLEDTFNKSRLLTYQNPSSTFQIQLLKIARKRGEQISLPFSDRINLAEDLLTMQLPPLEDYGNEFAKFSHAYPEGSDAAIKAENFIQESANAARKADLVREKWKCLQRIKDSLVSLDAFHPYLGTGGNGDIEKAFGDRDFLDQFNSKIYRVFPSENAKFETYKDLVIPRFDAEYPRVEKIIQEAREKDSACSEYLLTL